MMTSGATSGGARDHRSSLFTPIQWQELENQALIFKYMVSGVPIPAELIYSVKRSLDSSLASRLFSPQPSGFWQKSRPRARQMQKNRWKKWRCSKEAYAESKYCERHMHRGRNRSRKHVEVLTSSSSSASTAAIPIATNTSPSSVSSFGRNISMKTPTSSSSSSHSFSPLSSSISPVIYTHQDPAQKSSHLNPFLYSDSSSSSSRPPGNSSGLSTHDNLTTHHLFLDSGSCSQPDKDYRYFHGIRESVDERAFFPEASGRVRSFQDSCQPLMTVEDSYKGYSHHHQFQTFSDASKQQQEAENQQHCFVLGTDFKSARSLKIENEDETQKPLHHFFEEWTPKSTDSWLDLSSNSKIHSDS